VPAPQENDDTKLLNFVLDRLLSKTCTRTSLGSHMRAADHALAAGRDVNDEISRVSVVSAFPTSAPGETVKVEASAKSFLLDVYRRNGPIDWWREVNSTRTDAQFVNPFASLSAYFNALEWAYHACRPDHPAELSVFLALHDIKLIYPVASRHKKAT
jgi:hypothetical protein